MQQKEKLKIYEKEKDLQVYIVVVIDEKKEDIKRLLKTNIFKMHNLILLKFTNSLLLTFT
jgi:hypothetical protein